MNGYLARLAARAAGAVVSAQPRLPARFEPYGDETPTDVNAVDPVLPPGPAARPESTPTARPPAPLGTANPIGTATPTRAAEGVLHQHGEPDRAPGEPPEARTRSTQSVRPTHRARRSGNGQGLEDAAGTDAATPSVAPPPREGVVTATVLSVAAEPARATDPRPEARHATVVPAEPATQPSPLQPAGEPPTETVVQISIGRVEVRAQVAPPAAPPKLQPKDTAPPALDLHDYLRGRREAR